MGLLNGREESEKYVVLTMESDPEVLRGFYLARMHGLSQRITVKGFRKGKAPLDMVVNDLKQRGYWFSEVENVVNKVIDKTVEEVLKLNKDWDEKVFGLPIEKKILTFDLDKGLLSFDVKFEVFPSVTLGDYSKILTLTEERDVDSDFWPVPKEGVIGDKDVVSIVMEGVDVDGNNVPKYTYELLYIDLESTKINEEITKSLIGLKVSDKKEITIQDEGKSIILKIFVVFVGEKKLIDKDIIKFLGISEDSSLDEIKEFVKKQYLICNSVFKQKDLLKWMLSESNKIEPLPVVNIKMESSKLMKIMQDRGYKNYSYDLALKDQIGNLKSSLVVSEIAKQEDIKVSDEDREDLRKDLSENNWKYGHLELNNIDENTFDQYVIQFKVLKLLSNNLKFSN